MDQGEVGEWRRRNDVEGLVTGHWTGMSPETREASQPASQVRINCRARQEGYLRVRQADTLERVTEWDMLGGIVRYRSSEDE